MHNKVTSKITFEILEVEKLLSTYEMLLSKCKTNEPDLVEIAALATILHSFYNGIEKIFTVVVKEIDNNLPVGIKWHRDILIQVSQKTENRPAVISESIVSLLNEFMSFRHFYRHAYSFQLDWDKLKDLVANLDDTWHKLKSEIQDFLNIVSC